MVKLLVLTTTVSRLEDARRIADAAIDQHLAACVHIDAVASVYRWQGAVQHDDEQRLMFKTTAAAAPALRALVRAMHPYDLPALYTLEVKDADAAYAAWVAAECGGSGGGSGASGSSDSDSG
ncbi:MAG: divalent-cation tolerance protein CutA [Rubrivivax sp.]|nr:divalent-cation tolerance protein CutA [Rubrivivax sp.]